MNDATTPSSSPIIIEKKSNKTLIIILIVVFAVILTTCGCCGIFGLIGSSGNSDSNNVKPSPVTTTNSITITATATPVVTTVAPTTTATIAGINTDVTVNNIRYKVLSATDLGKTLKSDNQFIDSKVTSGKWIKVRFEVQNNGKSSTYLTVPQIIDAAQNKYEDSSEVSFFIPDEEEAFLENLNPGVTKTFSAIYEIPATSNGLHWLIGAGLFSNGTEINLGL